MLYILIMAIPKYKFSEIERCMIRGLRDEGKTMKEIAEMMSIPESTLMARLKYNGMDNEVKKTKKALSAAFKQSVYENCFQRQVVELEYEYHVPEGEKKGVPKLIKRKVKTVGPDSTCLKIHAVNQEKMATGSTINTLQGGDEERPPVIYVNVLPKGTKRED